MEIMKHTIHRLLSLLLVLALLICAVPAVFAEGEHLPVWKYEAIGTNSGFHKGTCTAEGCNDPSHVIESEECSDEKNNDTDALVPDGKCDLCGATMPGYDIKIKLEKCVTPAAIEAKKGTAFDALGLPTTVKGVVENSQETITVDCAVVWSQDGYNNSSTAAQTINGVAIAPTGYEFAENADKVTIQVTLKEEALPTITLSPVRYTLAVGSTVDIKATPSLTSDYTIEWKVEGEGTNNAIAAHTPKEKSIDVVAISTGTSTSSKTVTVTAVLKNGSGTVVATSNVATITIVPKTASTISHTIDYSGFTFDEDCFYKAINNAKFDYVTFDTPAYGTLYTYKSSGANKVKTTDKCFFNYSAADAGLDLDSIYFVPSDYNRTHAVYYTAYNTEGNVIATGKMELTPKTGKPDPIQTASIRYYMDGDEVLTFDEDDFRSALRSVYSKYVDLDYVLFDMDNAYFGTSYGGSSKYGYLYTDSYCNTKLTGKNDSTKFYYSAGRGQYDLDDVTYVPGTASGKYTVSIPYTAYATDSSYYYGYKAVYGVVEIVVNGVDYYTIGATGTDLEGLGSDILSLYPRATHVVFSQPTNGTLYYDYTAINNYGRLVRSNDVYALKYTRGEYDVDDVTLIPAAGATKVTVYFDVYSGNTKLESTYATFAVKGRSSSAAFYDVTATNTGTWSADSIDFMYANGLIKGVGGSKFSPNASMKRADLVVILYRLAGSPSVKYVENPFKDVKSGDYYYNAVLWAYANDVVKGSGKYFNPNAAITREQLATILYRYAGKPYTSARLGSYTDSGKVSAYALDAMKWAVGSGVVNGAGSKLDPQGNATRAQVATMLHRYLTK